MDKYIRVKNCNCISDATIEIVEKSLNIKYGSNGTGKSTISEAIYAQANNETDRLKDFKPYGSNDNSQPTVDNPYFHVVKVFNEDYVNSYLFQGDEFLDDSFQVFLKSDKCDSLAAQIERMLEELQDLINNIDAIHNLRTFLPQYTAAVKASDGTVSRRGGVAEFVNGNGGGFNHYSELKAYKPFYSRDLPSVAKWAKWRNDGIKQMCGNDCPFCTNILPSSIRSQNEIISKVFKNSALSVANAVLEYVQQAVDQGYILPDRYHKLRNRDGILHASPNRCKYRNSCRRWDVCKKKKGHKCRIPCRECISCNKLCPDFVDAPCPIEHKAPYVCNNCPKSISCLFDKYLYNADYAHKEYCETLRKSRQGIDMTRDELAALDSLVSPLIRKGQPLAHILAHHAEEIPCGERTLYKYISAGYLTARNLDMRRTVRYRKRVRSVPTPKISYRKKEGHHYSDYLDFIAKNEGIRVVQMDTVEGNKGGKLLHTLLWPENNLMLAFLIETKEMKNTVATLDWLEETLGSEMFRKLFPVILTDNGCEFADPELFEKGHDGKKRTRLFYCESRHSEQKGELEKNHEYIRYVLPKGSSFDGLNQEQVLRMVNHINNTTRPKLHGSTPMKKALKSFDKNAMEKLGLEIIPPDEICLKPELLK